MDKEDLIRTANTFAIPWESRNVHRIEGQSQLGQVATRGAGLALTLGSMAALTRALTRDNKDAERQEKLRSWAGSRFPVISADASLEDLEEERKLQGAGVDAIGKTAAEGDGDAGRNLVIDAADNFLGGIAGGNYSVIEPAVNMLASVGGVYGGYKLADYIADTRKKAKLGTSIEEKRNQIDKLIYEEYMRTRGLDKDAAMGSQTSADLDKDVGLLGAVGNDPVRSTKRLMAIGYTGVSALTFALAYKYSKDYHDKNDPARARMNQLKNTAKRRAMQTQAPMFLESGNLPDIQAGAKRIAPAAPKAPARVSTTPGAKAADPTDPLGSILNA